MTDKIAVKVEFSIDNKEAEKHNVTAQDIAYSLSAEVNDKHDGIDILRGNLNEETTTDTFFIEYGITNSS